MESLLHMEFWLDAFVAVLLVVTVGYCLVLNRRLTELRGNQEGMDQLFAAFTKAARQAENSVRDLKTASEHIGGALDLQMTDARSLTDELDLMTQSGNRLAARIESGLMGNPGQGRQAAALEGKMKVPEKLSESERESAAILRQPR